MAAAATPWDVLFRAPPMRLRNAEPVDVEPCAQPGSKLAGLLLELQGLDSAPTHSLAVRCDLTPRQVWGLLKAPRQRGQVFFDAGRWTINRAYAGHEIERAAALLRDLGWKVLPPTSGSN